MVLRDDRNFLTDIMESIHAGSKESAILFSGACIDGVIYIEEEADLQKYVEWSSQDKLKMCKSVLASCIRTMKNLNKCFVFLHTHPKQRDLKFSDLDQNFEDKVLNLAEKMEYQNILCFLVASAEGVIGRYYQNGKKGNLEIEISDSYNWLSNAKILFHEAMEKGAIYDPRSNGMVRGSNQAVKLMEEIQQLYVRGELPAEQFVILNRKLKEQFNGNSEEFLRPAQSYSDNKVINKLEILLQNGCNLNCRYCYADGGTYGQKTKVLTSDQGRQIILNLVKQGIHKIVSITFFGGEPSVFPETIESICKECKRLFETGELETIPLYYMITNCVKVSEKCIQVIGKYDIQLTISLDGPAEINDQLRVQKNGKGTYDTVVKNIERLRENNIEPVMIEATYTKVHEKEGYTREDTVSVLQNELRMESVYLCDCIGNSLEPKKRTDEEEEADDDLEIEKFFVKKDYHNVSIKFMDFVMTCCRKLNMDGISDSLCDAGFGSVTVAPNGDIYPCHLFVGTKKYKMGNVFSDKFNLYPTESSMCELRKKTKRERKECQSCWIRNFCTRCIFQFDDIGNADMLHEFEKGCEALKNRYEKVILCLINMDQRERKEMYAEMRKLQPDIQPS